MTEQPKTQVDKIMGVSQSTLSDPRTPNNIQKLNNDES